MPTRAISAQLKSVHRKFTIPLNTILRTRVIASSDPKHLMLSWTLDPAISGSYQNNAQLARRVHQHTIHPSHLRSNLLCQVPQWRSNMARVPYREHWRRKLCRWEGLQYPHRHSVCIFHPKSEKCTTEMEFIPT